MHGLGKTPDLKSQLEYTYNIGSHGSMTQDQEEYIQKIMDKEVQNIKRVDDLKNIYPYIGLDSDKFGNIQNMMGDARFERFGTNDPKEIALALAHESGKFPYDSPEDFINKYEYTVNTLKRAEQEYNASGSNKPVDEWLREYYPDEMENFKNLMDDSKYVDKMNSSVNFISRHMNKGQQ